jgi:hypothetical protein
MTGISHNNLSMGWGIILNRELLEDENPTETGGVVTF